MTTSLKAVYACGKVVTGITHGDAFSKLSEEEKAGNDFVIGNWCSHTGRFTGDDHFFFTKKILLIRHGTPACTYDIDPDPGLSDLGRIEVDQLGENLHHHDYTDYIMYSSPMRRCMETGEILQPFFGMEVILDPDLVETYQGESQDEICNRIEGIVERLPEKTIIISHCTLIQNVAQCIGSIILSEILPASLTFIDHQKITYFGKEIPDDETFC